LSIVYPHPNPKYGRHYAEVEVRHLPKEGEEAEDRLAKQLVSNPFRMQEAQAATDDGTTLRSVVKQEELEFLLRDLVADSYFDREVREGDVQLSVKLGGRTTRKPWDRISSFDQLMTRVQSEHLAGAKRHQKEGAKSAAVPAKLLAPTLDAYGSNQSNSLIQAGAEAAENQ
jgi:hypothetical protein